MTTRQLVGFLVGIALMIVVLLHPPWTATAVLARMDYTGFPLTPPRMVNDTATWRVPFAAVYLPPALDLTADEVAGYQRRLKGGDTSAAAEWRRRMESIERKYRVPAKFRSVWIRDSAAGLPSGVAYRRSIVSSSFAIDRARFGLHLLGIIVAVVVGVTSTGKRRTSM